MRQIAAIGDGITQGGAARPAFTGHLNRLLATPTNPNQSSSSITVIH
jgi:hypothetical protein